MPYSPLPKTPESSIQPVAGDIRPLRICLLGYRSKPHCGGQGVYIKYLSQALARLGHQVHVISGEPYPELSPPVRLIKLPGLNLFEKENRWTALKGKDLRSATNLFEWASVLSGGFPEPYTFGRRLLSHLAGSPEHYDIIHDNQSLCYALLKLQHRSVPMVATIHHPITKDLEIALKSARNRRHRLLIRRWHAFLRMQARVIRRLDHLLTVSNQSRQDIIESFRISASKIRVIHNGIDTDEFAPLEGVERHPFRIMATASADVPLKGLDYLLQATARLAVTFPDLELRVLGSPRPGGHTENLIHRLELTGMVRFVSNLTTRQINREYAEATLAVVPSLYEGFGLPAGEAMASGTPVISTTGGALPEVVGNAGILVPPADTEALAGAMMDLLKNPIKRDQLGRAGRERIKGKFNWELAARKMTRFYYETIQPGIREDM